MSKTVCSSANPFRLHPFPLSLCPFFLPHRIPPACHQGENEKHESGTHRECKSYCVRKVGLVRTDRSGSGWGVKWWRQRG